MEKIVKTNEEWKSELDPIVFHITREKGTEAPFTGKLLKEKRVGIYRCSNCGIELFASTAKFDSQSGWPSFDDPINRENVELRPDNSQGMNRTEVICARCGAHLGHVFDDGPKQTTGKRFCVNSYSLNFTPEVSFGGSIIKEPIMGELPKKSLTGKHIEQTALWLALIAMVFVGYMNREWLSIKTQQVMLFFTSQVDDTGYEEVTASFGDDTISLLIADTEAKRDMGLSGRAFIKADRGMLFVFPYSDRHGIWMKRMLMSIDIIWLDENMRVVDIRKNVAPDTYPEVFTPQAPATYALEMRAGYADRVGVDFGSVLSLYR